MKAITAKEPSHCTINREGGEKTQKRACRNFLTVSLSKVAKIYKKPIKPQKIGLADYLRDCTGLVVKWFFVDRRAQKWHQNDDFWPFSCQNKSFRPLKPPGMDFFVFFVVLLHKINTIYHLGQFFTFKVSDLSSNDIIIRPKLSQN